MPWRLLLMMFISLLVSLIL